MTEQHPNAQTVLRGFAAFAEGDMETMRELFADDAVWHAPGRNRFSGDYRGVDEIVGLFQDISAAADIENRLHAVLADDEHVVVLVEATLQREGKKIDANNVFVFHVDDGNVTEVWATPQDAYSLDEFWAD